MCYYTHELKKEFSSVKKAIREIQELSWSLAESDLDMFLNFETMSDSEAERLWNDYYERENKNNMPNIEIRHNGFSYCTASGTNEVRIFVKYEQCVVLATYEVVSTKEFHKSSAVKSFAERGWQDAKGRELVPEVAQEPLWDYDVLPKRERILRP